MKIIKQTRTATIAFSALVAVAFAPQTIAETVNTYYDGLKNGTYVSGGGLFEFKHTTGPIQTYGADNRFVTFCIDLDDTAGSGWRNYAVVPLAGAPDADTGYNKTMPMGTTAAGNIAVLLGNVVSSGVLNDAKDLAPVTLKGIQLALWELIYETQTGTAWSIKTGTHTRGFNPSKPNQNSAAIAAADDMLKKLYEGQYLVANKMEGLVGLTHSVRQDYIGQVPLPAAAWLFISAVVGAAAIGRRKKDVAMG